MQDKLNSLISWFDKVINQTIIRDLDKANANVGIGFYKMSKIEL